MADNVQPDAGDEREESASGLLISTDPLQQPVNYRLAADDDDGDADDGDRDGDNGDDSDDSVLDNYVGQRPTVIEAGDDGDDGDDDSDGDGDDGDDSDVDDGDGDDTDDDN